MNTGLKEGDKVIVIADGSEVFTILSIYGEGKNAICKSHSTNGGSRELSIPMVALCRYPIPGPVHYRPSAGYNCHA